MSQKFFKVLCKKLKKRKKHSHQISFYIAFDELYMERKFYIPHLLIG